MRKFINIALYLLIMLTLIGCKSKKNEQEINSPHSNKLLFYLDFDENEKNTVTDEITKKSAKIEYVFNDAKYQDNLEPKWVQSSAVNGSSLVFDGYSNKICFEEDTIKDVGLNLTIDVFVAPRMFEWSAPGDYNQLQVIVGKFNKTKKEGFMLGMHKYGNYSFQIGLGNEWVEVWNEWNPLDRYVWNHITATYDGNSGQMKLYKNGELVNLKEDVYGNILNANEKLIIGAHPKPQYGGIFELNMYNGLMDELKIFNYTYDDIDVEENHNVYKKENKINEIDFNDVWLDESILYNDIYRPIYHANPPQHWMNEPHALFYYNGYYHMFYQFNLTGPYWRQIVWGHWISKDMITWTNLKEAVIMNKNSVIKDGVWSGSVAFKDDGTPVLFITAGDDEKVNLYSNQNLVLAVPKDLNDPYLTEWVVAPELAITLNKDMGKANEFRDFSVYKEEDTFYLLATGAKFNNQGTAYIYSTKDDDFNNWTYHGHFFEPETYPNYLGSSWELVHLTKVYNKSKTQSKYVFIISPAGRNADNDIYYYLGNFNKTTMRFEAEHEAPLKMDFGENVFTGPGIYHDVNNDRILITSIIQDLRNDRQHYDAGWAHNAGMPRELYLNDYGELAVKPIEEIYDYVKDVYYKIENNSKNKVNEDLKDLDITNQTLYIKLVIENVNSNSFGFKFKKDSLGNYSSLEYIVSEKEIIFDTRNSGTEGAKRYTKHSYDLKEDIFLIEVVIDHSMIEIYINNEKTITASIYNLGNQLEIISDNEVIISYLTINDMRGKANEKGN
jgi:sucrose-6-phosphate hydrolase SacC (GH32 family)